MPASNQDAAPAAVAAPPAVAVPVTAPQPEKDLGQSKAFWGIALIMLNVYGPKWGISEADQHTVIGIAQNIYSEIQQIGGILGGPIAVLGTLVRRHRITSVFGFKLQGASQ